MRHAGHLETEYFEGAVFVEDVDGDEVCEHAVDEDTKYAEGRCFINSSKIVDATLIAKFLKELGLS